MDSSVPVIDYAGAMDRLDNDDELYRELALLYLDDTPKQIAILLDVLDSGDSNVVERQAHSIKSASANVGLERLRLVAAEIESAGRNEELARAKELFEVLKQEFTQAQNALAQYS
jgi:HPt (histidine-containing phosphotransfer) domain-containing protein